MSRMKIATNDYEEQLKQLEKDYKLAKINEQEVKSVVTDLNSKIKSIMVEHNLDSFNGLTLTTTQKDTFNELQAIEILRDKLTPEQFTSVVKTKEYIDDDALEKLIYNSSFDASVLTSCKTPGKVTYTLRVK